MNCFVEPARGSSQRVGGVVGEDHADGGGLQSFGAIDGQVDGPWRFADGEVDEAAERAVGGESLANRLQQQVE